MQGFPVDIWAIKDYGIEKWHRNFHWPAPICEFERLRYEIEDLYLGTAKESHPDIEDACWVLFSWTGGLAKLLHKMLVIQRVQEMGKAIQYSASSHDYRVLAEGEPIRGLTGKSLPSLTSGRRKLISDPIRTLQANFTYHGFDLDTYLNPAFKPHHISIESGSTEVLEVFGQYAKSRGRRLDLVRPSLFLPRRLSGRYKLVESRDSIAHIIEGFSAIASSVGLQLTKMQQECLTKLFVAGTQYVMAYIHEVRRNISSFNCTSILLRTVGNTAFRSLCAAGKREGFHMVGFPHGDYVGTFNISTTTYVLQGLVDTYVVPSEGAVELSSMAVKRHLHKYEKQVDVVCCGNAWYEKRRRLSRQGPMPSSIDKVMIIESAITPVNPSWVYQLDFNLRIAILLHGLKIKTSMKRHPDRLKESEGVYDRYCDELLTEPFEIAYEKADAYIIPHIGTTAFGVALLTNKPIIIFSYVFQDVWEQASDLIRKRCRVIPSHFAEDGSIVFDESKLIEALQDPPEEPNDEFIERYYGLKIR